MCNNLRIWSVMWWITQDKIILDKAEMSKLMTFSKASESKDIQALDMWYVNLHLSKVLQNLGKHLIMKDIRD